MMGTKSTRKSESSKTLSEDTSGTFCQDDAAETKMSFLAITLGKNALNLFAL